MWLADNWKEYEVIDCSEGEKLERWGKYTLLRPDPEVRKVAESGSFSIFQNSGIFITEVLLFT